MASARLNHDQLLVLMSDSAIYFPKQVASCTWRKLEESSRSSESRGHSLTAIASMVDENKHRSDQTATELWCFFFRSAAKWEGIRPAVAFFCYEKHWSIGKHTDRSWYRGFCNAWRENWRKRTTASTQLQWRGFVVGFLLLCCVVQSFAFAEVGPTASIPSTQNESWPLWRAEWRFTNSLHAACRTFFSWFPFPSFSFPHSDLYLHVLLDSYIGVIVSTYRYALTSWFYPAHFWAYARTRTPAHVYPAHTHAHTFPRPVDSSAFLLLLFLSVKLIRRSHPTRKKKIVVGTMHHVVCMHTGTLGKRIYETTWPSACFHTRAQNDQRKRETLSENFLFGTFQSKPVQQASYRPGRSISSLSANCVCVGHLGRDLHIRSTLIRNLCHALTGDNLCICWQIPVKIYRKFFRIIDDTPNPA